jgi:hypothetical protein
MIIAHQKKRENIIEYILYMWQVEDLIRANELDMKRIDENIISKYNQPADTLLEIREWWDSLVEMMLNEQKSASGHLQININTINDINQLHLFLLKEPDEMRYRHLYQLATPFIQEFEMKSALPYDNDISLCITAIYSSFLLKLQGKEISKATAEAIQVFSQFLAQLAKKYKLDQEGKLRADEF